MNLLDSDIYRMIGDDGFQRLVTAFYRRVPADEILGPMYSGRNLTDAQWRLREFLVGRFGGPERYIQKRGHPRLRMRHNPFTVDQAARNRWILLMEAALDEAQLPTEAASALRKFFHDTSTFLINQTP